MTTTKQSLTFSQSLWYGLLSGLGGGAISGAILTVTSATIIAIIDGFTVIEILLAILLYAFYGGSVGAIIGTVGGVIGGGLITLFNLIHNIHFVGPLFGTLTTFIPILFFLIFSGAVEVMRGEEGVFMVIAIILLTFFGTIGGHIGGHIYKTRLIAT